VSTIHGRHFARFVALVISLTELHEGPAIWSSGDWRHQPRKGHIMIYEIEELNIERMKQVVGGAAIPAATSPTRTSPPQPHGQAQYIRLPFFDIFKIFHF
jgi:hypothetical protein